MAESDRNRAIELAMGQIEKQFGKGSIMRLGEDAVLPDVKSISTGALSLNIALGIGGVPRGRIVEIYGPESSGKTTLALHIAAEAQKVGGVAAFIDAEHALDVHYAKKLGVNTDELLISQPDTGEQALEIVEVLVRSGAVDVLVVDSVAALVPRAEIEGEMGDSHMGLQARLNNQQVAHLRDIHQPDPHEDRCHVRQPRNHHRRQRPEVLRLRAHGHPQDRFPQAGAGCDRQPHQGQGCQEQDCTAFQRGRI
ncbi:MAG: hypothetical protein P8X54_07385 [Desulfuromonadales bacterium]